ncbi:MAG: carboxypeptidase regulatory-like domain-containing protein [Mariniphaga sp.]|nr:carboxypeptidase regulatory-like domain-containing protein [Mariniphaga sp.]
MAKPASASLATKNATANLAKGFKEADDLLTKRMDLDIELFKTSNPDFYNLYKSARVIKSSGSSKNSVLGNVILAATGAPIKGVTFIFTADNYTQMKAAGAALTKPVVKTSTAKGNIRIDKLSESSYTVSIQKIGFKDQTIQLFVVDGETTRFNIEMERL